MMDILSDRMAPRESELLQQALRSRGPCGDPSTNHSGRQLLFGRRVSPEVSRRGPSFGAANRELENLSHQDPQDVSWERLSADFGVPHPVLAQSYSRELINVKPFPPLGGSSNRLFAESWDSTNLYWARLADEMGYSPVMLNSLVPELTESMVAKIFASNFQDWDALLEAMQQTGAEFRQGKIALLDTPNTAAGH